MNTTKRNSNSKFGCCNVSRSLAALLMISTGICLIVSQKLIVEKLLKSLITLSPTSPIKPFWQKVPVDVPTEVYFFNWTNPEDFYDNDIKPKFTEIGPYRYMQSLEKVNITWNDNDTVSYTQRRFYYYDEKHKNGNLNDEITTINIITAGVAHYFRNWNVFFKTLVESTILVVDPTYYTTKTAREYLEGYKNDIIDICRSFPYIGPEIPRLDIFGWLNMRNGTTNFEGMFNTEIGINRTYEVLQWNYKNTTEYGNSCNRVQGSAGEIHTLTSNKDYIYVFIPDLCRHIRLDYERETVVEGISGLKYVVGPGFLDNGTKIKGNECFCDGQCVPYGMVNVSGCHWGLNFHLSLPHYCDADPIYLNAVEGLSPSKEKHEAYMVIEPTTLITLAFNIRIQFNSYVHPIEGLSMYQDVREMYFPVLWFYQRGVIPEELKTYLKAFLYLSWIITSTGIFLTCVGLCLILFVFHTTYFNGYSKLLLIAKRFE